MREFTASYSFTRPADTTAYTSGDLVANSTTAGSVTPMSWTIPANAVQLQRARIKLNSSTNTNASFRLHLYAASPTCANGDNGAWSTTSSTYLGDFDIDGSTRAFTDNIEAVSVAISGGVPLVVGSGTIYGLLEARAAYTPTSGETITVTLIGNTLR